MHTMASDDTEITLGMGKLLGLFFLLAAICGVFFSIGYSLGKSSGREQALNDQPGQVSVSSEAAPASSSVGEDKPSAAVALKSDAPAPSTDEANAANQQSSMTFYKAVQQSGPSTAAAAEASQPTAASTPAPGPKVAASGLLAFMKPLPPVQTNNAGVHVIHCGGDRQSFLQIPVIPAA